MSVSWKLAAETGAILVEPDALLTNDGKYDYTPQRYGAALQAALDMVNMCRKMNADCIFADVLPTLPSLRRVAWYWIPEISEEEKECRVAVIEMPMISVKESKSRNKHSVMEKDIRWMRKKWEAWPGAISVEKTGLTQEQWKNLIPGDKVWVNASYFAFPMLGVVKQRKKGKGIWINLFGDAQFFWNPSDRDKKLKQLSFSDGENSPK